MNTRSERWTTSLSVCLVVLTVTAIPGSVAAEATLGSTPPGTEAAAQSDGRAPAVEMAVAERAQRREPAGSTVGDRQERSLQEETSPAIAVRPDVVQFPNETDEQFAETVTVTNEGDAPLAVESALLVDATDDEFAYDGPSSFTIDPNESRTLTVSFTPSTARSQFASLRLLSNDSNAPQVDVWLTNTQTVADISPSMVLEDRTIVNATVQDATVNASQTVNLSWPLTRDDAVAVDALSLVPRRSGDFDLSVAKSSDRLAESPAFDLTDGTESSAFVRINHTIDNENVSDVDVAFRVRKELLAGNETGPEDVALYRYQNGSWVELPTQFVGEGGTHYFFRASSPGLSDFVTGIKQAKFRIDEAVVSVTTVRTGEGVDTVVRVTNVGSADGTYDVELILQGAVVDRRELSIAPGGTRQAIFERSFDAPGSYDLYVNDRFVANVAVVRSETTGRDGPEGASDLDETVTAAPGFGVVALVTSLLVLTVGLTFGRRR
ncbi:PGF-pre-PGF domain-containing protein [Halogranum amylolyticum]|nr:PGF-pre-PGF domain-containing protein [Halogranum amylolyticum]